MNRSTSVRLAARAAMVMLLLALMSLPLAAQVESSWRFSVLLDGKPVGEHVFRVMAEDGLTQVQSDAQMQVSFLFFNAYSYQHRASELWQNGCLLSIDAKTNNNNKQIQVKGRQNADSFLVSTGGYGNTEMPACVKSFAYWDRTFLQATELLNSQTGELVDVAVETGQWETIEAGGQEWIAQRHILRGEKLHIELWYGAAGEWLRLSSVLPSGRKVDYLLVDGTGWNQLQRAVKVDIDLSEGRS